MLPVCTDIRAQSLRSKYKRWSCVMPPRWNDPDFAAGTMVRAALWLLDEIGEGNSFTKEQVREAFPGVSQADRRIRDLRNYGWVIHTSSDDAGLNLEEQRLVSAGVPVRARKLAERFKPRTSRRRNARPTLAHDAFQCVMCGIAGGEAYPDAPSDTAVLESAAALFNCRTAAQTSNSSLNASGAGRAPTFRRQTLVDCCQTSVT